MVDLADIDVTNDPDAGRYEARAGGELLGFAAYRVRDGAVVFTRTEVEPAHEGQGVGTFLVHAALEDVRMAGDQQVVAQCPFVRDYLEQHEEYAGLLA